METSTGWKLKWTWVNIQIVNKGFCSDIYPIRGLFNPYCLIASLPWITRPLLELANHILLSNEKASYDFAEFHSVISRILQYWIRTIFKGARQILHGLPVCRFIIDKSCNSPKTITNVILMVFTFAFGISPLELALLQSGSFSKAIFLLRASVNGTECNWSIQETQQLIHFHWSCQQCSIIYQVPKRNRSSARQCIKSLPIKSFIKNRSALAIFQPDIATPSHSLAFPPLGRSAWVAVGGAITFPFFQMVITMMV